ncbi:antibiotic biosynthesis monooxygenase [Pseudarthrobacter sp. NPDC080039]|uniref:antibiotic biosynthesis monooxygenase n=1 Tax=unclassified Pseudarthrobacter TaxID=2647000 RepID=UPI00344B40D1
MHAAVLTVTIDPEQADDAEIALRNEIVPMVSSLPGFVAAYWLEAVEGQAMVLVVFDTEQQAHEGAPPVGLSPTAGVTIADVKLRRVAASA